MADTRAGATVVFVSAARVMWGAEQSLFTLAASMRERGDRPVLVCFDSGVARAWSERDLGPAVLITPDRPYDRVRDIATLVRNARRIPRADAVVLWSFALLPAVPVLRRMPALRNAAFACDLHDNLPGRRGQQLLRLTCRALDAVVAVSRCTAAQVDRPRPAVLYRPISTDGSTPAFADARSGPLVVGMVGRVDRMKEHLLAVAATRCMRNPVSLVIRGDSAYTDDGYVAELKRAAAEAGTTVLEGRVAPELAMAGLDVLLVANRDEPMGRTVAEAQLAGVPVVVPDEGGAAELVADGETGLHFRAGDERGLAEALDRLVEQPALRARVCRAAFLAATERHDPEQYAAAYVAALFDGTATVSAAPPVDVAVAS